jgi:hypothetical protein
MRFSTVLNFLPRVKNNIFETPTEPADYYGAKGDDHSCQWVHKRSSFIPRQEDGHMFFAPKRSSGYRPNELRFILNRHALERSPKSAASTIAPLPAGAQCRDP